MHSYPLAPALQYSACIMAKVKMELSRSCFLLVILLLAMKRFNLLQRPTPRESCALETRLVLFFPMKLWKISQFVVEICMLCLSGFLHAGIAVPVLCLPGPWRDSLQLNTPAPGHPGSTGSELQSPGGEPSSTGRAGETHHLDSGLQQLHVTCEVPIHAQCHNGVDKQKQNKKPAHICRRSKKEVP